MQKSYLTLLLALGFLFSTGSLLAQTPPANDDVCNAINLMVDGTTGNYSNVGATDQPGEDGTISPPTGDGLGNGAWFENSITNSVWFTFTAPASGGVLVDLCNGGVGTDFDTQVAVYEVGNCANFNSFSVLAANDDIANGCPGPGNVFASVVEVFCLTPGNTYYVMVDGWFIDGNPGTDTVGNFSLTLTDIPNPPLQVSTAGFLPTCGETDNGIVTASAIGGGEPYNFTWTTPGGNSFNTQELTNATFGTYQLSVTDGCGFSATDSVVIAPPEEPTIVTEGFAFTDCDSAANMADAYTVEGGTLSNPTENNVFVYTQFSLQFLKTSIRGATIGSADLVTANPTPILVGTDFANGILYGLGIAPGTNDTYLYAVNPADGATVQLGINPIVSYSNHIWVSATYDAKNNIFYGMSVPTAVGGTTPNDFVSIQAINLADGQNVEATRINLDPVLPVWIAADTAGQMYFADIITESLFSLDISNGEPTKIGSLGFQFLGGFAYQDADFDPITNELYGSAYDGFNQGFNGSEMRRYDTQTGNSVSLGTIDTARVLSFAISPPPADPYEYRWSPTVFLDNPDVGNPVASPPIDSLTYTLTVTDACGTTTSAAIQVVIKSIALEFASSFDAGTNTGSVTVTPSNGTAPYDILWEGGATTASLDNLPPGVYRVTVTDAAGCTKTDSVSLGTTGLLELGSLSYLRAYPNPTTSELTVELGVVGNEAVNVSLLDASGRALMRTPELRGQQELSWNLSQLPRGMYILQVSSEQGHAYRKIFLN